MMTEADDEKANPSPCLDDFITQRLPSSSLYIFYQLFSNHQPTNQPTKFFFCWNASLGVDWNNIILYCSCQAFMFWIYIFRGALRAIYWCRKGAKEYIQSTFWEGEYKCISFRSSFALLSVAFFIPSQAFVFYSRLSNCFECKLSSGQALEGNCVSQNTISGLITFCCDISRSVV